MDCHLAENIVKSDLLLCTKMNSVLIKVFAKKHKD